MFLKIVIMLQLLDNNFPETHTMVSLYLITVIISLWLFGIFQRLVSLKKYKNEISAADYAHVGLTVAPLAVGALYFYSVNQLVIFLSGFAFAYLISTLCTVVLSFALVNYILEYPMNQKVLHIYSILFCAPSSAVMFALAAYLGSPFVWGAACAVASMWVGYVALLD